MNLRRVLIKTLKFAGIIISAFAIYFILVVAISYIPVNNQFTSCEDKCISIFLLSNGVHTDIVLPMKTEEKDWNVLNNNPANNYVAFGWGDKGFYLETPTWADLKFSTAFKALFFLSSSAMHVTLFETMNEGPNCRKITITKENYKKLISFIESSFQTDAKNDYLKIDCTPYGKNDKFYEAKGTYNLFYTCNTWTNNCIKYSGLRACLWTLFDDSILNKYQAN